MRKLLLTALLLVLAIPAFAQMDMMPELFRDLPPEIREGLPISMDYQDYRELTRNVDFFTMFMSMFVPGYGLFQVEEPLLGAAVLAGRLGGYAMMAGAVIDQWDHFQDLTNLEGIDETAFRRFVGNAFLFGGGIVVNGLLWAADVIGAYHIANDDRGLVRYTYGIRAGIGGEGEEASAEYLRRISLQDESRIAQEIVESGRTHLALYPDGVFAGEVAYRVALAYAELGREVEAALFAARQLALHPDPSYDTGSRRLGLYLVTRNRVAWGEDAATLETIFSTETAPTGLSDYLLSLSDLSSTAFVDVIVNEAGRALDRHPDNHKNDAILLALGRLYSKVGSDTNAAAAFVQLAALYPDSAYWEEAAYRAAALLAQQPASRQVAVRLLRETVDRFPAGSYAEQAREDLRTLGAAEE